LYILNDSGEQTQNFASTAAYEQEYVTVLFIFQVFILLYVSVCSRDCVPRSNGWPTSSVKRTTF